MCEWPPRHRVGRCSVPSQREDWGAPPAFGRLFLPLSTLRSATRNPLSVLQAGSASRRLRPSAVPFRCLLFLPVPSVPNGKAAPFCKTSGQLVSPCRTSRRCPGARPGLPGSSCTPEWLSSAASPASRAHCHSGALYCATCFFEPSVKVAEPLS